MQSSFNKLLSSSLSDDDEQLQNNEHICLISQELLDSSHIKLSCSHKFNYNFIYIEIMEQKNNTNLLETQKLKKYQFKCPYCRNIQSGVLPYLQPYPIKYGVNFPPSKTIKNNNCEYLFLSGKRKNLKCSLPCTKKYCIQHYHIIQKRSLKTTNTLICSAITKKGTQCKKNAKSPAGKYCLQHLKQVKSPTFPIENVIITI